MACGDSDDARCLTGPPLAGTPSSLSSETIAAAAASSITSALTLLSRSIYLDEAEPSYYYHRCEAYLLVGDLRSALANITAAKQHARSSSCPTPGGAPQPPTQTLPSKFLDWKYGEVVYLLGQAALDHGRFRVALRWLSEAARTGGNNLKSYDFRSASLGKQRSDMREASRATQNTVIRMPSTVLRMVVAFVGLLDYEQAVAVLDELIAEAENEPDHFPLSWKRDYYQQLFIVRAKISLLQGNTIRASDDFKRLCDAGYGHPEVAIIQARIFADAARLKNRALEHVRLGQYRAAIYFIEKAVVLDPKDFSLELRKCALLRQLNEFEPAIAGLRRILEATQLLTTFRTCEAHPGETGEKTPADKDDDVLPAGFVEAVKAELGMTHADQGYVHMRKQEWNAAIDSLTLALHANPEMAKARKARADCYLALDVQAPALEDYLMFLSLCDPERSRDGKDGRVDALRTAEPDEDEKAEAEAAKREAEEKAAALYAGLAKQEYDNSKLEAAVGHLNKAIELDPTYAPFYFQRAQINLLLQRTAMAQEDVKAVLRMYPGDEEAEGMLWQLTRTGRRNAVGNVVAADDDEGERDDADEARNTIPPFPMQKVNRYGSVPGPFAYFRWTVDVAGEMKRREVEERYRELHRFIRLRERQRQRSLRRAKRLQMGCSDESEDEQTHGTSSEEEDEEDRGRQKLEHFRGRARARESRSSVRRRSPVTRSSSRFLRRPDVGGALSETAGVPTSTTKSSSPKRHEGRKENGDGKAPPHWNALASSSRSDSSYFRTRTGLPRKLPQPRNAAAAAVRIPVAAATAADHGRRGSSSTAPDVYRQTGQPPPPERSIAFPPERPSVSPPFLPREVYLLDSGEGKTRCGPGECEPRAPLRVSRSAEKARRPSRAPSAASSSRHQRTAAAAARHRRSVPQSASSLDSFAEAAASSRTRRGSSGGGGGGGGGGRRAKGGGGSQELPPVQPARPRATSASARARSAGYLVPQPPPPQAPRQRSGGSRDGAVGTAPGLLFTGGEEAAGRPTDPETREVWEIIERNAFAPKPVQ